MYEQAGHVLLRKWLMLNNPNDSSGVMGYLKVIFVSLHLILTTVCLSIDLSLSISVYLSIYLYHV